MAYGLGIPRLRLHSPFWQNFIVGILIGLAGGLYVALNLLGAGGGKPNSFALVQVANSTLCAVYAVSAFFGGTVLNTLGPAITGSLGLVGYVLYIGGLWYFDGHAHEAFPIFGAVMLGISAGLIYVTQGYISMSYSEEKERGMFVSTAINLQALGATIGGLIPLLINRNKNTSDGVPAAVYATFIAMDCVGIVLAFALRPPEKVIRDDGTNIAVIKPRTFMEELKGNFEALKDWRLWVMVPAFLCSESFLVYLGSVNAFNNSLRARSLCSFCAVVGQIFGGFGLQLILDNEKLPRRKRAFWSLAIMGAGTLAAWIWEVVRTRHYDRANPPKVPYDWTDPGFGPLFVLFMLNWVSSQLMQYVVMWYLGCFTNNPRNAANNAGVFRAFMAGGEAVIFGIDSAGTKYVIESSIILAFYALGMIGMLYLAMYEIENTKYFKEEEVTIPVHVQEEHARELHGQEEEVEYKGDLVGQDPTERKSGTYDSKTNSRTKEGELA